MVRGDNEEGYGSFVAQVVTPIFYVSLCHIDSYSAARKLLLNLAFVN